MKRMLSLLLSLMLLLSSSAALAGSFEPWKGDQGGKLAQQIEKALAKGQDPARVVNAVYATGTGPAADYVMNPTEKTIVAMTSQPDGFGFYEEVWVPVGQTTVSQSAYAQFRNHAKKWYEHTYSLVQDFGSFGAYYSYALNAETNNYYKYGHNAKMTLESYLLMVVATNKMPYAG